MLKALFQQVFDTPIDDFTLLPENQLGKIYLDLPHRFFGDIASLKDYVKKSRDMGANVLLLLPHFLPSFSEYVVKNYEHPCSLFQNWETFTGFMEFVEDLGMDRMIDIPFNHADWEAENLKREWYKIAEPDAVEEENEGIEGGEGIKESEGTEDDEGVLESEGAEENRELKGIEAGADDEDADGERVRINWGAFVLDNGNPDLIAYWLEKVIFPHLRERKVNAIRIDAAWGLDPDGLKRIVQGTKEKFPDVWFVAENLGMERLITLAESGLEAGAERYFNNFYWYSGGRYIPSDVYRFRKQSGGKPTCTIFSSHDTLMPAMKAFARLKPEKFKDAKNDKAIHREIVERDKTLSISQLPIEDRERILRLMKLDFILAAFMSTDLMWVAGSESGLLERVDVLRSGPSHFSRGEKSDLSSFMTGILRARASEPMFNSEGVVIPFGSWQHESTGCRGYVKLNGAKICLVAVNMDLEEAQGCPVPQKLLKEENLRSLSTIGFKTGSGSQLGETIELGPGQAVVIYN